MADSEKARYLELIAGKDPKIRSLLEEGFEFVTNALRPGCIPPGIKAREDREVARRLRQEGYAVELSTAYDEQGNPRATMSSVWRKKARG